MNSARIFPTIYFPTFFKSGVTILLSAGITSNAFSQESSPELINTNMAMDSAPLIIGLGAVVFAVLAMFLVLRAKKKNIQIQTMGQNQVAQLRAQLDEYEAILSCMPEITLLWQSGQSPQVFGRPEILGFENVSMDILLNFDQWLGQNDGAKLATGVKLLRQNGHNFAISVRTTNGRILRAVGEATGGTSIVRLRNATDLSPQSTTPASTNLTSNIVSQNYTSDMSASHTTYIRPALEMLLEPAWVRNADGKIDFANQAYMALCEQSGMKGSLNKFPDIFTPTQVKAQLDALHAQRQSDAQHRPQRGAQAGAVRLSQKMSGPEGDRELVLSSFEDGSIGYLRHVFNTQDEQNIAELHIANSLQADWVIDTLAGPTIVFDQEGKLKRFNTAYRELFRFSDGWLATGLNEREILDRLRREKQLPTVSNYREWRQTHLEAYKMSAQRKEDWHLADGRSFVVTATPIANKGGVIYQFEDVSGRLRLESANKAMLNVQRQTLNALSEGVAVFSTDGRLRLHNPRLSSIWKLPMNELGLSPHVDSIALACGHSIPEDGEEIWQDLKKGIIDLDPSRKDTSGRIKRQDGRLIDYAIVRLADYQTMITFVDVTKSANFEHVLKERNDALVTADALKDAFIQNVSYEFRSPLTSIIGFADLMASDNTGPLTDQQRNYIDYIRSSSAALGTLIDGILDLTNVEAGIAELDLQELNIAKLIEDAKTGFSATLVRADGMPPLNLVVTLPDPLPRFVADGARVVQILYNLISNAAKFSEPGAQISLDVEGNNEWIRFTIKDEGVGITRELEDALTGADQGRSLKSLQRGAGIGLTIVKAFVELHGGNLAIIPNTPRGSQVIVNLPADASKLIEQTA